MQYRKVIEELGYTPKEAKIYITSLRLGEARITDIANAAEMARNSAQVIVDKLHKDGIMSFYVLRRYKYWSVDHPERLLTMQNRRLEIVREALPALTEIRNQARKKSGGKKSHGLAMIRAWSDSTDQPMLVTDTDAIILYVNPSWERQFGYALKEVLGKNTNILSSGKTPKRVYQEMWQALEAGKMFQTEEVIDKKKDGTYFSMLTTLFSVSYGDGNYYIQLLQPTKK